MAALQCPPHKRYKKTLALITDEHATAVLWGNTYSGYNGQAASRPISSSIALNFISVSWDVWVKILCASTINQWWTPSLGHGYKTRHIGIATFTDHCTLTRTWVCMCVFVCTVYTLYNYADLKLGCMWWTLHADLDICTVILWLLRSLWGIYACDIGIGLHNAITVKTGWWTSLPIV